MTLWMFLQETSKIVPGGKDFIQFKSQQMYYSRQKALKKYLCLLVQRFSMLRYEYCFFTNIPNIGDLKDITLL